MSWIGPAAKNGAKLAKKHGPKAVAAWQIAGKPAKEAVSKQVQAQTQRRKAYAKAATVIDGHVLRVMDGGEPVWVVLTHGEPVEAFPSVDVGLPTLIKDADLSRAVSSEDFEAKRVKSRLERARKRAQRN